ncbi:protein mono-ADP-ribosyltransferase PARP9-like [Rana temporaria]|uniref:protein mono-ADP-ribosyltransferase PARP9-like n=1 Tax=Rana temporaria TaxID=8407 RepID=UPI001AAC9451|nr:protein mono-ADP-ribosyltransferase PARP9-like [Rana temporaria]
MMDCSRRINLPESTYFHLLGCKEEITDLFLRKFRCVVELSGPEPNRSHPASVKAEKVYEKRTSLGPVVSVWRGDLTKLDADVVVNSANEDLDHAGGLARALVEAGGPIIEKDSKDYIKANGRIKTGEYAVTRPGNLPCKCLLHVVGPVWFKEAAKRCDDELSESIKNVLRYVNQHKDIKSVAIPAVSSGIFGFPVQRCADIIVNMIHSFCFTVKETHVKEIRLVNNNDPAIQAMKSACESSFGPSEDLSGATSGPPDQQRPTTRSMTANLQPSPTTSSYKQALMQPSAHRPSTEKSQPITIDSLTLHLKHGRLIQDQKVFQDRLNFSRASMNTGTTVEGRDPRADISDKSSNSRDSETPCLIINAMSDEDAEEAEVWLTNIPHPHPVSIHNNLVLLFGQEEHDFLSSPDFPNVTIKEKLSYGMSGLEIDGFPQDKFKGVIQAERLLLDVQEKHAVTLEEELVAATVVWFYKNESGARRYPAKANREIEKAFVTQSDIKLRSEPHHSIFIKNITAEGKDGAFWLERRTLFNSSKDVQTRCHPDDWLSQVVKVNRQAFLDRAKEFREDKLTLVKMEKIHNRYLSKIFQYKKGGSRFMGAQQLYQVVPKQFTRLVCDVGFQRVFSNPTDPNLGKGIYFTNTPKRAVGVFQTPKEESGLIYIFQAEVLTGNSTEGRKYLPVLVPKKSSVHKSEPANILDLYDTLVNTVNSIDPWSSTSIYVIPDSFRANPQYLFTVRR